MLDYDKNTKDWIDFKLSRLGIFETEKLGRDSTYSNLNENDKVVSAEDKKQDNVYKLSDQYYQFEKRELTKEDEMYINLKLLDASQYINENTKTIKNCIVFFVVIIIISLIISGVIGFMTFNSINDMISSLYY